MISTIIIVALIVLAFHVFTWPGMVFSFVSSTLKDLPDYIKKPLYDCPTCSTIWWGSPVVACGMLAKIWSVTNVWQLAIIVTAAAGLNTIFSYIINQGKAITKTLNSYECNCTKKEDKELERKERIAKLSGGVSKVYYGEPKDFNQ